MLLVTDDSFVTPGGHQLFTVQLVEWALVSGPMRARFVIDGTQTLDPKRVERHAVDHVTHLFLQRGPRL